MTSAAKELSGLFMSSERWDAALLSLQEPSSAVSHVRLFHNTARHVRELCSALASAHNSCTRTPVTRLFIGDLDPVAAEALGTFLASPLCVLSVLELQNLGGSSDSDSSSGSPAMASQALAPGLQAASTLTELQLQRCHDQAALTTLAEALASRPHNTASMQLGLQCCRIGASTASRLGDLAAGGTAPVLSLSNCQLPDSHLHSFLSAMQQPLTTPALRHLNLSSTAISPRGAAALASLLPLAPHLTTLILEGNAALSDEGAAALGRGAALSPSLTHLDLADCGVGAAGAAALAAALGAGAALQRLRLDRNAVGASGLLALTAAMRSGRCSLRELSAEACHISGTRLTALGAPTPAAASPLHVLRLGGNVLGDSGVAWLVQMLLGSSGGPGGLRGLEICDTDVGDAGAEQLVALLAASPQLRSLLVDRSSLQDRGAARLCAAALQHPQLRSFSLKGGRHMGMPTRARAAEASSLLAQRGAAAAACEPRDTAMQEAAHVAAAAPAPAPRPPSPRDPPAPCSSQPAATGAMDCMEHRCSSAIDRLELQPRSSCTGEGTNPASARDPGPAAAPKPHPGAAAKHRLEPDQLDAHAAKHHHMQADGASSAAAAGSVKTGARLAEAAWLPAAWQPAYQAASRAAAGQLGKTFSGCSATSLGAATPTSPISAHCVAYVTTTGDKGRRAGAGVGTGDRQAEKPAVLQRGSAEGSGSDGSSSDGFGEGRCSGGSGRTSPGSCSGIRSYGRRFRPLTQEQQLLFADF